MNIYQKLRWLKKKWRWNKEYASGKWDFMEKEEVRYQKIIDYFQYCENKNPTILDLGCAYGILREKLKDYPFTAYMGIDFSEEAIKKAQSFHFSKSSFEVADLHQYLPNQKYDIIIFNEVLYYLNSPMEIVEKIMTYLEPNGIIIYSLYKNKDELWDALEKQYTLLEKNKVYESPTKYWDMGVFTK